MLRGARFCFITCYAYRILLDYLRRAHTFGFGNDPSVFYNSTRYEHTLDCISLCIIFTFQFLRRPACACP